MAQVEPVSLKFVRPELTGEVPSPPHDALDAQARRQHLRDHPLSYLGVTRSPEDVDSETPDADVLEAGKEFLQKLLDDDVFGPDLGPCYFIYRLELDGHQQTGLVCAVATEDYETGVVRIHERINEVRAKHLAKHLRVVGAQSSPIALAFNVGSPVTEIMARTAGNSPAMLDFVDDSGLRQQLWQLSDSADIERITSAFREEPLYLIDGHHRAAAASEDRRGLTPTRQAGHRMLATLFPSDELRSEAFHRILTGVDLDAFEQQLFAQFPVRWADGPEMVAERTDTELALALPPVQSSDGDGPGVPRWCLIDVPFDLDDETGLSNIDPMRLANHVLNPLLDLQESGADGRLAYRPGTADLEAINAVRLRQGEAIFLMRPIPASTVMSVSDGGQVMPPKSTYFLPKVRSGIFIRFTD